MFPPPIIPGTGFLNRTGRISQDRKSKWPHEPNVTLATGKERAGGGDERRDGKRSSLWSCFNGVFFVFWPVRTIFSQKRQIIIMVIVISGEFAQESCIAN